MMLHLNLQSPIKLVKKVTTRHYGLVDFTCSYYKIFLAEPVFNKHFKVIESDSISTPGLIIAVLESSLFRPLALSEEVPVYSLTMMKQPPPSYPHPFIVMELHA